MIDKILSTSRNTEVDAASMRIIGAYNETGLSTDPHLVSMFTSLEEKSALLTAAINRSKAESDLEAKDEVRDEKVRALNYLIMGYLHHPNAKTKEAAQQIVAVFEKYGVAITGESYATESSLIVSLLGDLAAPDLADAINKLSGCAECIAELTAAQTDFEQTRIAYETEKAEESTHANATALKNEVLNVLNEKIVIYMRAMEIVDEVNYGAFARTITTIIADNNEVVKKRRKKGDTPDSE